MPGEFAPRIIVAILSSHVSRWSALSSSERLISAWNFSSPGRIFCISVLFHGYLRLRCNSGWMLSNNTSLLFTVWKPDKDILANLEIGRVLNALSVDCRPALIASIHAFSYQRLLWMENGGCGSRARLFHWSKTSNVTYLSSERLFSDWK